MTKTLDEERERCRQTVVRTLRNKPLIYTLTTYGRGATDWVRLFVGHGQEIEEITYYVARASRETNIKLKPGAGWPFRGAQYNKGLEAADWASRIAYGKPLDQYQWREL